MGNTLRLDLSTNILLEFAALPALLFRNDQGIKTTQTSHAAPLKVYYKTQTVSA